ACLASWSAAAPFIRLAEVEEEERRTYGRRRLLLLPLRRLAAGDADLWYGSAPHVAPRPIIH
uniref:Uncharacterized protein n=1 Tax=Oryza meridionalis TaxID=40149 RepID=A0A0E0DD56_9ORYZ